MSHDNQLNCLSIPAEVMLAFLYCIYVLVFCFGPLHIVFEVQPYQLFFVYLLLIDQLNTYVLTRNIIKNVLKCNIHEILSSTPCNSKKLKSLSGEILLFNVVTLRLHTCSKCNYVVNIYQW